MYLISDGLKAESGRIDEEVSTLLKEAGGTETGARISFERKLAYKIKHNWRGVYTVLRFTVPNKDEREETEAPDTVAALTHQLNLHKDILRYIIVDASDLPALAEFDQKMNKSEAEDKKVLKEKGEKIDGELEKALKI